jgi:hypothetical protein
LIVPHDEWFALGSTDERRLAAYRALFDSPIEAATITAIREAANGNASLGSRLLESPILPALGPRVRRVEDGHRTTEGPDIGAMPSLAPPR